MLLINALVLSIYVKSHASDLYVSCVLRTDEGKAVYSRTFEVLRNELTDGEENDAVKHTQRTALDAVFTADMLRNELHLHIDHGDATGVYDDEYGVLLHSMNNICDYYTLS